MSNYVRRTSNPLSLGLALIAGTGLTIMIIALALGVLQAAESTNNIGGIFTLGLILLIAGVLGWVAVTQPYKHFDDINEPHYHGHDHHEEAHDDHAIVVAAPHTVVVSDSHDTHAPSHS